ncbi:MAG TPA: succinate dehydrogenase assembly factor 2 [Devosiaceae bacterium]|nr:succinate dehydrogenase assembly factor 2 [Devosiaceae bacterium]
MAEKFEAGEELGMRRRRLRYRAWHRGTREMDMLLGPFADAHADAMDGEELQRLEGLMEEPDPQLLKWVMGQEAPPAHVDQPLLQRVINFRAAFPPHR